MDQGYKRNQYKRTGAELLREADWAEKHIPDTDVPQLSSGELKKFLERIERVFKGIRDKG